MSNDAQKGSSHGMQKNSLGGGFPLGAPLVGNRLPIRSCGIKRKVHFGPEK